MRRTKPERIAFTLTILVVVAASAACQQRDRVSALTLELSLDAVQAFGRSSESVPSASEEWLELPSYMRFGPDGWIWVLDTGRQAALAWDTLGNFKARVGVEGHGPGELDVVLGLDVSHTGDVWVADAGNGKVARLRPGGEPSSIIVNQTPLGVVVLGDEVWLGGDLVRSLLTRYTVSGERLGGVGLPINTSYEGYYQNQGVLAKGTQQCAAVWSYSFRAVIQCFDRSGRTLWRVDGPVPVAQPSDRAPGRLSSTQHYSYIDVAANGDRIYALFVGGSAAETDLHTSTIHVFGANTGQYLGQQMLPEPAKRIARRGHWLASLTYEPVPTVQLYRVLDEK